MAIAVVKARPQSLVTAIWLAIEPSSRQRRNLAKEFGHEIRTPIDNTNRLPIHEACASLSIGWIEALVQAYPESLEHQDSRGMTPIHLIFEEDWRARGLVDEGLKILDLLVSKAPRALLIADGLGKTPLHCAFERQASIRGLSILLKACPRALRIHTRTGLSPVQCLLQRMPPVSYAISSDKTGVTSDAYPVRVLNTISKKVPSYFSVGEGRTLAHYAVKLSLPRQIFQTLGTLQPSAFRDLNFEGRLPLHEICLQANKYRSIVGHDFAAIIRIFLDAHPEAASTPCAKRKFIPLQYLASQRKTSLKSFQVLLEATQAQNAADTVIVDSMIRAAAANAPVDNILTLVQASVMVFSNLR